jgi:hypothetical protein
MTEVAYPLLSGQSRPKRSLIIELLVMVLFDAIGIKEDIIAVLIEVLKNPPNCAATLGLIAGDQSPSVSSAPLVAPIIREQHGRQSTTDMDT